MDAQEKYNLQEELKEFLKGLKKLKRHLENRDDISLLKKNLVNKLREELVYKVGRLKGTIIQLTGKQFYTQFGSTREFWSEGLSSSGYLPATLTSLGFCIDATNEAIGRLESTPPSEIAVQEVSIKETPKAFIAHGGDSPALRKLKSFLEALGVQPLVVEEQPSEGRSVAENVDWYVRQADCAIILATKGDIDGKTGRFIPRGNVLIEIGKSQELFKDRIIYLLQAGTKLPTNISEKVRARFTTQNMDNAFIKIAKELKKFGILKAVKP